MFPDLIFIWCHFFYHNDDHENSRKIMLCGDENLLAFSHVIKENYAKPKWMKGRIHHFGFHGKVAECRGALGDNILSPFIHNLIRDCPKPIQ